MRFHTGILARLGWSKRERALSRQRMNETVAFEGLEPPLDLVPNELQHHKLATFAQILGISENHAAKELYARMFSGLPNQPLAGFLLPDIRVKSCARIDDELMRIELLNGRVFLGQRSNENEYLLRHAFKSYLPTTVDGDAYKLALDVQWRYFSANLPWYALPGGLFVEGGCFTGMKAIGWHDSPNKPTRIIAVEIGSKNAELLAANIRANELENVITPVHAGLWRESGEGTQKHAYSTRRFMEATDRWENHMLYQEKTRLLTAGDLLDEAKVDVADYFNVLVNGAEIEVMKVALNSLDRVKVIDIAAYYTKDGNRNVNVLRNLLTAHGCTILNESARGRIAVVTPKYRDEILALKPKGKRKNALTR